MNSFVIVPNRKTRIDANSFGAEQTKDILDDARERVKKRKNEENQSHDKQDENEHKHIEDDLWMNG